MKLLENDLHLFWYTIFIYLYIIELYINVVPGSISYC